MIRRFTSAFLRRNPRPDTRAVAHAHPSRAASDEERAYEKTFEFVVKLARALHRYGYAAPAIEDALDAVCKRLGVRGEFFATPTAIFASLDSPDHQETVLIRVEPGNVNLDKLSRLDRVAHDVAEGKMSTTEASRLIDEVRATPPRYRGKTTVVAAVIASAGSARFFGGGWREVVTCAVIGCVSGLLSLVARRNKERFQLFEPVAAFLAGVIACAAAKCAGNPSTLSR